MARDEIEIILSRIDASERRLQEQWEKTTQHISGVGSDVRAFKQCFDKHIIDYTEFKHMLAPLVEAKVTLTSLGKFVGWLSGQVGKLPKWVAIPLFAFLAGLLGYKISL